MAKHGVRFKPEQIVSLLRQIEVLTATSQDSTIALCFMTLDQRFSELPIVTKDHSRSARLTNSRVNYSA